ncbi:glycosyltransferase [Arthrobacter sp. H14-L1]|uniref:glycosyltransferase n=1 Tax=Arthrobacter sp. H14-L1 TaxID=2996697 RepID=UPI002270E188|nr:glycosyltransferase family 2 protein [Arthrobacter sp. H14-L1]
MSRTAQGPAVPPSANTAASSVSLVIPAFNEEAVIRRCVTAAINQSSPADQIIVVDNKSTDRTCAIVQQLQQEYPESCLLLMHQDQEQGLIPTRNYGLDRATSDILGRIDADSLLEPDWVEQVRRAFADPAVCAATGPVLYYDMPLRRFGLRADDTIRQWLLRLAGHRHNFLYGSNMALRRAAWEQIRTETCRDPEDQMHEDIDLSLHLAEHSLAIAYVPNMVSGTSARRLENPPKAYCHYLARFGRTYAAHNVRNIALKAPMVLLLLVYFPAKALRAMHLAGVRQMARQNN